MPKVPRHAVSGSLGGFGPLLLATSLSACAGSSVGHRALPEPTLAASTSTAARAELRAVAEAFYRAETPGQLEAAVERARQISPTSAVYHELAGVLAGLRLERVGAHFEHAYQALRDPQADVPHLRVEALVSAVETIEEERAARGLLATLAERHPDPTVRARARRHGARLAWLEGDFEAARGLEATVRSGFDWRIIGAWDNDQGKGFDERLPPEVEVDFDRRYDGALLEVGWRTPAIAPVGPQLDLRAALTPDQWALAYAVTAFEVTETGPFELRVTTSAPVKVWVDGEVVLTARAVKRAAFDQFVVAVELAEGRHRLLVKSAQAKGAWTLGVRVTDAGGAPSSALRPLPAASAPTGGSRAGGPGTAEALFAARVAAVEAEVGSGARALVLLRRWAEQMGLKAEALAVSDALLQRHPKAILPRFVRARATWDHGERGKASDLVESLAADHGDALPYLHVQAARLSRQEGLQRKARTALARAADHAPPAGRAELDRRWARQFATEGWTEDRCRALESAVTARPGWREMQLEQADCLEDLGFHAEARRVFQAVFDSWPGHTTAPARLLVHARDDERFEAASSLGAALVRAAPNQAWPHLRLAEVLRRQKRWTEAEAELDLARALDPDDAAAWAQLARIRYQAGQAPAAIAAWKESLLRNPDDDRTANRLAFLAPEDEGIWSEDVPDEAAIEAALAQRGRFEIPAGAHSVNLLDHEVTLLKADGSTTDVVTMVVQALDETGRDQLTKIQLRRGGRLRMLAAYVVGPNGRRTQVSNVRSRVARFRNLSVGSTVVLQYRHDAKPIGYLSRHIARGWWFQASSALTVKSQWVLWLPEGSSLHEWIMDPQGRVERQTRTVDGRSRVSWTAEGLEPLIGEPNMPTLREVAVNMLVSTVPDWATFLEWEKALLTDVFRDDASIEALARRVVGDAQTPRDKAYRIHAWLMQEIRYQQDYENNIAGVRPHAAPVVVERSYGDCKDKSVLFITLARQVGLEAQFALLRTRPKGPLLRSVPMQQFDHAIVYVPAQPGLDQGFFIDSTADALDVTALRQDDTGVPALVLDPETNTHRWRDIPLRPPEENRQSMSTRLALTPDGSAVGALDVRATGMVASALRRLARNGRALEQGLQGLAARLYGGAIAREVTAVETKDLTVPAHLRMKLEVASLARREGAELRARIPPVFSPKAIFQLETRAHPLVLGPPQALDWTTTIDLPRGLRVRRVPSDVEISMPCFRFERSSRRGASQVVIEQRYVSLCERIEVDAYPEHRKQAEAMMRAQEEELVLIGSAPAARAAR